MTNHRSGRHGGLMVSALDSEASGLGLNPGRGHYVVFLARKQFTITVLLSQCLSPPRCINEYWRIVGET